MNISDQHLEVIQRIVHCFRPYDIEGKWIIAGGVAQKINGLVIDTQDIDILTDTETAFIMNKALKAYCLKEVEVSGNQKFHSAFGQFEIEGTLVEIAGDLQIKGEISYPLSITEEVMACSQVQHIDNYPVYFEPLEESLIADMVLERTPRVTKIVEQLKRNQLNRAYIDQRLANVKNSELFKEKVYGHFI